LFGLIEQQRPQSWKAVHLRAAHVEPLASTGLPDSVDRTPRSDDIEILERKPKGSMTE